MGAFHVFPVQGWPLLLHRRVAGLYENVSFLLQQSIRHSGRFLCADGVRRFVLDDLSVTAARKLPVPLQSGSRRPRGSIAVAVARRYRRKRSTME